MTKAIVHACDYSSEYGGNFIASLSRLRETCRGRGWEFVAVFPEAARERPWCARMRAEKWRVRFIPDAASAAGCAWSIAGVLLQENAELIHTHFSRFDGAAWLAANIVGLSRFRRIRVVWHIHSDFEIKTTPIRRLKDLVKFRVMGAAAHLFLVSEHLKGRPLRAGFGANRMLVIPNGIDFSRVDGPPEAGEPFRGLDVKKDAAVLMFGWHPLVKGVDVALAAFEILARAGSGLTLLIVGCEETRDAVRARYPQGEPHWVRVLPPVVNVADYLHGAAIFLSASRREGFPYSVFEAGASGCLLVASDIPALRWIKKSVRFWWFRNEDPAELAGRIVECAALREDERRAVTRANAAFIREHLPVEKWAAEVAGAYARICAGGTAGKARSA